MAGKKKPKKPGPKAKATNPKTARIGANGYVRHPLGGLTPANTEDLGTLIVSCPSCGEIVTRDDSETHFARSVIRCGGCGEFVSSKGEPNGRTSGER
jgi:hypothetical protein